jgi:lyso-ornithine lipid O-acyltransferase
MRPRSWLRSGRRAAVTAGVFTRALLDGRRDRDASPVAKAAALAEVFAGLARHHGLAIDVVGEPPARACVVVANHLSYMDPIALLPVIPALPICKGEVGEWPLVGPGARATGVMLVDRASAWSGARVLRRAMAALAAGASVLNFPEGTTTEGDRVLPFRRGIFGAARLAGAPILPVALAYGDADLAWTGDQTFIPHYLRTAARERIQVRVTVGAPFWPARRPAADLATEARRRILILLGRDDHDAAVRVRVPETRPDSVLSAAAG